MVNNLNKKFKKLKTIIYLGAGAFQESEVDYSTI